LELKHRSQIEEVNSGIDLKSSIGRGGYIRNILFEDILFANVEGRISIYNSWPKFDQQYVFLNVP